MIDPASSLSVVDLSTILGPIVGALVVSTKIVLKSIDSKLDGLSAGLRSVNARCALNHPGSAVPPAGPPNGSGEAVFRVSASELAAMLKNAAR